MFHNSTQFIVVHMLSLQHTAADKIWQEHCELDKLNKDEGNVLGAHLSPY